MLSSIIQIVRKIVNGKTQTAKFSFYESAWIFVGNNGQGSDNRGSAITITHGLNSQKLFVKTWFSAVSNGAGAYEFNAFGANTVAYGCQVQQIDNNRFYLYLANDWISEVLDSSGDGYTKYSGAYVKILVMAL